MIHLSNAEFLQGIFGGRVAWAHVTSFPDDPSEIVGDRRPRCWGGNYYSRTSLAPGNQYYTISQFAPDEDGKARRRKHLFSACFVIVVDDVREKIPVEQANRLPEPSYILETSPGSEQWGYILQTPCTDRMRVENLLDGLVARGLAPDGKDPGMKGVTRYVRLPEGVNTKANRVQANGGVAPACRLLSWAPHRKFCLEDLAGPFNIDLDAARRTTLTTGAADVADHPLLGVQDLIHIKKVLSPGRYDITCPWVDDHTGKADDGAAVFTNADGSLGFKCHHGSCACRTGGDLVDLIESHYPGFKPRLGLFKAARTFAGIVEKESATAQHVVTPLPNFLTGEGVAPPPPPALVAPPPPPAAPLASAPPTAAPLAGGDPSAVMHSYQDMLDQIKLAEPMSETRDKMADVFLRAVETLDRMAQQRWWTALRDVMNWNEKTFGSILKDRRAEWYKSDKPVEDFYSDYLYVSEQNAFYSPTMRLWLPPDAFQNTYNHVVDDVRGEALGKNKVEKVFKLDYAPGMPRTFIEHGVKLGNGWVGDGIEHGVPGDVQRWLDHFDVLGWQEHKKHILQWMAYTMLHPGRKINHMLILGGGEGTGKDFLLFPLITGMRRDCKVIDGNRLLTDFNEWLVGVKYLHINEAELGDHKQRSTIKSKLKPYAAGPPETITINPKGFKSFEIRNVVNTTMTTNSCFPLEMDDDSRRYYGMWTDLEMRDSSRQVTPEWREYWKDRWSWMRDREGWKACVHYLRTQVDLFDFDAAGAPYLTEFIREIQEHSQDPVANVLKDLVRRKVGMLAADLVTSSDVVDTLRGAVFMFPDLRTVPGANTIGKIMKQNRIGKTVKAYKGDHHYRIIILRDREKYEKMTPGDLCEEYQRQSAMVRKDLPGNVIDIKRGVVK